jgi:hypothetical protein
LCVVHCVWCIVCGALCMCAWCESKRGREGTMKGRKAKEGGGKKGGTQDELNQRGPK